MLTRKDYSAIADLISSHTITREGQNGPYNSINNLDTFVHNLSDYFKADNPRFNREKFCEAAGVEL